MFDAEVEVGILSVAEKEGSAVFISGLFISISISSHTGGEWYGEVAGRAKASWYHSIEVGGGGNRESFESRMEQRTVTRSQRRRCCDHSGVLRECAYSECFNWTGVQRRCTLIGVTWALVECWN